MNWKAQLIKRDGESRIAIYFEKNYDWIDRIKQQEGSRWSQTLGVWHLPDTIENRMLLQIVEAPIKLPSAEGIAQIEKFKCWLLSRRYSDSTIITYSEALKSFLTFYNDKAVAEINNDDVIRYNLGSIFNIFDYESVQAHMIKITRDAQLEIDSDQSKSLMEKISTGVKDRLVGEPVRFVYDQSIGKDTLKFFLSKMGIDSTDSIIPGGRYHNRRDYMNFPNLGRYDLLYNSNEPLPVRGLSLDGSILDKMRTKESSGRRIHMVYNLVSYRRRPPI